jgi:tRNA-dihydrouridine synthase
MRVLTAAQRLASGGNLCGVDLNLGCPQACARDSNYGVFLAQRDPDRAVAIVRLLATEVALPVSCKLRVVGGVEGTVRFAKRLDLDAVKGT